MLMHGRRRCHLGALRAINVLSSRLPPKVRHTMAHATSQKGGNSPGDECEQAHAPLTRCSAGAAYALHGERAV